MMYFLLLSVTIVTLLPIPHSVAATTFKRIPQRFFSSRNIHNIAHNLIIRDKTVILQRKSDVLSPQEIAEKRKEEEEAKQKAIEKAQKDGKPPPDFDRMHQQNLAAIDDGEYEYRKPPDGCYILENGFTFCSQDTKIIKIFKEATIDTKDYFFYQKDLRCKIAKYNFMYNFMYHNRFVKFHEYQLAFSQDLYPELVRILIISQEDLLEPEELDEEIRKGTQLATRGIVHNFTKDLLALFISYKKDVGCLPFKNIKLFSTAEEKLFPIFLEQYALAGQWIEDQHFQKDLLIKVDGPIVTKYNKNTIPAFKMKLIEHTGIKKS